MGFLQPSSFTANSYLSSTAAVSPVRWPQYYTPLMQVNFRDWLFEVDKDATSLSYSLIDKGEAESSLDDYSQEYLKFRDSLFPKSVLALFMKLGVDYKKDKGVICQGMGSRGKVWYETWFDFKGSVVSGPSGWDASIDITDDLLMCVVEMDESDFSHYFGKILPVTSLHFILKVPL